jgi:hypothetical protein
MSKVITHRNLVSISPADASAACAALKRAGAEAIAAFDKDTFVTLHRASNAIAYAIVAEDFPKGYTSASADEQIIMATEMGMDDGWRIGLPRFRSDDTSAQSDAYRSAYRDAADDRITTTLHAS